MAAEAITHMLKRNSLVTLASAMLVGICLAGGCSMMNKRVGLEDNHPLEELTEEVIRQYTDIDVNLSDTEEK